MLSEAIDSRRTGSIHTVRIQYHRLLNQVATPKMDANLWYDRQQTTIRADLRAIGNALKANKHLLVAGQQWALGIGEGSETNLPLARAVIGGLTVSTVFTLFLVPCLYTVLDRFAKRSTPDDEGEGDPLGSAAHA